MIMQESDADRISKMMKIVNEVASSVTDASNKADPDTAAKVRASARTLLENASKNSDDVDELFTYLRNAKNYGVGQLVDDVATKLGAKTLEQRWDELKDIYYDP
jgi:hypothetical protein